MRRTLIVAGLVLAVAAPAVADAASCSSRKTTGTVVGAVGGGLIGGALTHGIAGPLIGAGAGAVVGHEIGRSGCRHYTRTSYYRRSSRPSSYAANTGVCRYETRSYYDERGRQVYAPVKVCH